MKALYALVFVLFSFAAPAQTLETAIAEYHLDDLDCSEATTQQSAVSAQLIATEPTIEKPGEAKPTETDGVAATEANDAKDASVEAVQLGEAKPTEAKPTETDGVAATEPNDAKDASVEAVQLGEAKPTEAKPTEADGVATTEPKDAKETSVGAVQPSDESSTAKYSTLRDDKPTVDDTSEQSAVSLQIIVTEPTIEKPTEAKPTEIEPTAAKPTEADGVGTTEPQDAKEASVEAVQPSDESSTAKYSTVRDDKPTVDDTSGQSAVSVQIIATEPTIEKPGEAKPTEADGVATPKGAEDAPVEAAQPSDESSTAKHATLRDDKPTVDDTSGQSAMPAHIIATEPTIEKPTEAKPTEAKPTETDGVATTALKDAEDAPVEAIAPNDENATVKSDREARN